MAGTYAEDVALAKSGMAGLPTTFVANASDAVTVRSITFKASHLVVQGVAISGAPGNLRHDRPGPQRPHAAQQHDRFLARHGIGFTRPTTQSYTQDVTIAGNTIARVGRSSTYGNDLTVIGDRITVQDNDLSGTPNDAINLWGDSMSIVTIASTTSQTRTANTTTTRFKKTWSGVYDGAEGHAATTCRSSATPWRTSGAPTRTALWPRVPARRVDDPKQRVPQRRRPMHHPRQGRKRYSRGTRTEDLLQHLRGGRASNTIEFNLTSSGTLANNIFYNCKGYGSGPPYYVGKSASIARDYNIAGGTSPRLVESHGQNADPAFADAGHANFHLTPASPAVNAGDNGALINPLRAIDLDGTQTQGSPDVGAYEYR